MTDTSNDVLENGKPSGEPEIDSPTQAANTEDPAQTASAPDSNETLTDADDSETSTTELWLSDEAPSDSEGKKKETVPLAKFLDTRNTLKGNLRDERAENEALKERISALESQLQQGTASSGLPSTAPKWGDYEDDEAYHAATLEWHQQQLQTNLQEQQQRAQLEAQHANVNQQRQEAVNAHYERAQALVNTHDGLNADMYQQADMAFRNAVNQATGQGDLVTDVLIEMLRDVGEGSEKVLYYVGKTPEALATLQSKLMADTSGFKAYGYLNQILHEKVKNSAQQSTSQAPSPSTHVKGGDGASNAVNAGHLKREYAKFSKQGNIQQAFKMRRAAKKAGLDVSSW